MIKRLCLSFLVAAGLLALGQPARADSFTPRLGLRVIDIHSTGWGVSVNTNTVNIDTVVAGQFVPNIFTATNTVQNVWTVVNSSFVFTGQKGYIVSGSSITAGTFFGPLVGNVTGNVTGNLTGNVTGNSATATAATNLAGGGTNQTPYQTGASATGFLPQASAGGLVFGNGAAGPSTGTVVGTTNRVTASYAGSVLTLTGPQDLGTGNSPSFSNLTLTGSGSFDVYTETFTVYPGTVTALGWWGCKSGTCSIQSALGSSVYPFQVGAIPQGWNGSSTWTPLAWVTNTGDLKAHNNIISVFGYLQGNNVQIGNWANSGIAGASGATTGGKINLQNSAADSFSRISATNTTSTPVFWDDAMPNSTQDTFWWSKNGVRQMYLDTSAGLHATAFYGDGTNITGISGTLSGQISGAVPVGTGATTLGTGSFITSVSSGVAISTNVTLGLNQSTTVVQGVGFNVSASSVVFGGAGSVYVSSGVAFGAEGGQQVSKANQGVIYYDAAAQTFKASANAAAGVAFPDPPGVWTCTVRQGTGANTTIAAQIDTVSCSGTEKVISGGCVPSGTSASATTLYMYGGPSGQGWSCAFGGSNTNLNIKATANCCL